MDLQNNLRMLDEREKMKLDYNDIPQFPDGRKIEVVDGIIVVEEKPTDIHKTDINPYSLWLKNLKNYGSNPFKIKDEMELAYSRIFNVQNLEEYSRSLRSSDLLSLEKSVVNGDVENFQSAYSGIVQKLIKRASKIGDTYLEKFLKNDIESIKPTDASKKIQDRPSYFQ